MLEHRKKVTVAGEDDGAAKILLVFHQSESHFYVAVRFASYHAVLLLVGFYRLEVQLIAKLRKLAVETRSLEMPPDKNNLRLGQRIVLLFEHVGEVPLQRADRYGVLFLIIVCEVVKLDASEVGRLTRAVFFLKVRKELCVIYFPAQAFFTSVKQVGGINEGVVVHRVILPALVPHTHIAKAEQGGNILLSK